MLLKSIKLQRMHYLAGLAIIASMPLWGISSSAQTMDATIEFTQFEVTHPTSDTTKLTIAAQGTKVKVGSYMIRIDEMPEGGHIDNTYVRSGKRYINENDSGTSSFYLLDNGNVDEDPRVGVFSYTFHTHDWKDGQYTFMVDATNRPAPGGYRHTSRPFRITKGNFPKLPVSNIPGAINQDIYQKEGIYASFPNIYIQPDSTIGISFGTRVTRSHVNAAGGGMSLISADNGRTWEKPNHPLISRRWQTKDGRLVRAQAQGWISVDVSKEPELRKQHKIIAGSHTGTVAYLGGAEFETSTDGGKTWTTTNIPLPEGCLGLNNRASYASTLLTSKNVRLRAVYGQRFDPDSPTKQSKREVYFLRSDDDGKSWTCSAMYPKGILADEGFNETGLVEAADGTIIAMMRTDSKQYLWEAKSKDGGITWSKPTETKMWGFPANVIRLRDGRLLCAYGYRRIPMGVRASISYDNGKTWDVDHELIIRQDGFGLGRDLGYISVYELPDGKIFSVYYITTDGQNTHIASTIFELPK